MAVSINDAGRAALSSQIGPNVTDIEGRLVQRDSAAYVLTVSEIRTFRDGTQVWSGERVRINSEYVNIVSERRFSRGRTVAIGAAAVGIVAILAAQGIIGSVTGDDGTPPTDTSVTIKIPLFIKR